MRQCFLVSLMPSEKQLVKVRFPLENGLSEGLWAIATGPARFRLDNIPFYAYGVSLGDLVEAELDGDALLIFVRVVEKSGNRTLRILLEKDLATVKAKRLLQSLVDRGCSYEGAKAKLISVCIPPAVSVAEIAALLDAADGLQWETADP
jgi:hypothetical protein